MFVHELQQSLLGRFPLSSAEPWDHVGLSAGSPLTEVRKVAIALDATADTVRAARDAGANVLLTHHPAFISAPSVFTPDHPAYASSGSAVYEAIRLDVSIISLHTNLDRSVEARKMLPSLMGLSCSSSLEFPSDPSALGLGALCPVDDWSLSDFASRAQDAFGTCAQVWGDPDSSVHTAAFLGGSLGDFGELALNAGANVIVTGEAGYHRALDLCVRGLSVITLGHDRSEQPFCSILAQAARDAGVPQEHICRITEPAHWWVPAQGGTSWV